MFGFISSGLNGFLSGPSLSSGCRVMEKKRCEEEDFKLCTRLGINPSSRAVTNQTAEVLHHPALNLQHLHPLKQLHSPPGAARGMDALCLEPIFTLKARPVVAAYIPASAAWCCFQGPS